MKQKKKQRRECIEYKSKPLKITEIEDSSKLLRKYETRKKFSLNTSLTLYKVLEDFYNKKKPQTKTIFSFLLNQSKNEEKLKKIFFVLKHGIVNNNKNSLSVFFSLIQRRKKIFFQNTYLLLLCNTLHLLEKQEEKRQRVFIFIVLFKIILETPKRKSFDNIKKQNVRKRIQETPFDQNELNEDTPSIEKTKEVVKKKLVPFLQNFIFQQKELEKKDFLKCVETCLLKSLKFVNSPGKNE